MRKLFILLLLSCFISCEEIIEVEDISGESVSILAPSENSILNSTIVTFTWNSLEDAEQYQIQIATPDFENASQIVIDTIITSLNITKTLNLGMYQWRVRGENSEFQTQYTTQSFTIE